jgi:hypothetical protein
VKVGCGGWGRAGKRQQWRQGVAAIRRETTTDKGELSDVAQNKSVLSKSSYSLKTETRRRVFGEHFAEPDVAIKRLGTRLETCLTPYKISRHILAGGLMM